MTNAAWKALTYPRPLRSKLFRQLIEKFRFLSYPERIEHSAIQRPHYGYCLYHGAQLAKRLGHKRMSAIEFGVAGGNGLVNLEMHAAEVARLVGIDIEIYGFDTGGGLPPPEDYRDLPYHWKEGFFAMDQEALKARLKKSKILFGDVGDTLEAFARDYDPAPIGAIYMDLDYYSSTQRAFKLFNLHRARMLPRAFIYFDDVIGSEVELYSEYTGVRLAINEFNVGQENQKICGAVHLTTRPTVETWHHQIYIYHDFTHQDYNKFISEPNQQIKLRPR